MEHDIDKDCTDLDDDDQEDKTKYEAKIAKADATDSSPENDTEDHMDLDQDVALSAEDQGEEMDLRMNEDNDMDCLNSEQAQADGCETDLAEGAIQDTDEVDSVARDATEDDDRQSIASNQSCDYENDEKKVSSEVDNQDESLESVDESRAQCAPSDR